MELDISFLQTSERVNSSRRVIISNSWKEGESKAWDMLKQEYLKQFMDFNVVYVRKNESELKLREAESEFLEDEEV